MKCPKCRITELRRIPDVNGDLFVLACDHCRETFGGGGSGVEVRPPDPSPRQLPVTEADRRAIVTDALVAVHNQHASGYLPVVVIGVNPDGPGESVRLDAPPRIGDVVLLNLLAGLVESLRAGKAVRA